MQLFLTDETHYDWQAALCRRSPVKHTLTAAIMLVAFVAFPVLCWYFQGPLFFLVVFTLMGTFMAWLMIRHIVNLFRSGNWTMAIQHDELVINLRSFHNGGFTDAETVLHLPFDEIAGARICSAQVDTFTPNRRRTAKPAQTTETSVDLADFVDSEDLKAAILEESHRLTPKRMVLGIPSSGRFNHIPVSLIQPRTLRIYWTGPRP